MSPLPLGTPADQTDRHRGHRNRLLALLLLLLLAPTGFVVAWTQYHAAEKARSGIPPPSTTEPQTSTTKPSVPVSSVSITDDQTEDFDATPLFDHENVAPGASGSACIEVRYTGTVRGGAHLAFSVDDTSAFSGLDQYLALTVTAGTGVTYGAAPEGTCAGFAPGTGSHATVLSGSPLDTPSTTNPCFTSASSCRIWDYGTANTGTSTWQTGNVTDYEIHWAVSPNTPVDHLPAASTDFTWTSIQAE